MLPRPMLGVCKNTFKTRLVSHTRSLATVTDTSASPSSELAQRIIARPGGEHAALYTALILNRSPLLTRTPTAFEQAYYDYQTRIERALHTPLPYEFYFKSGSPLEYHFDREERAREKKAFGRAASSSPVARNEGEDQAALMSIMEQQKEVANPEPRETEADRKGDVKSLDRKGERNLYLITLARDDTGKEAWRFPQAPVYSESLFENVQKDLRTPYSAGMDTWVVSRKPIGLHKAVSHEQSSQGRSVQDYLFFYKAHILTGQVRPDGKRILDFAWLTKEEIQPRLEANYWNGVKDMLSDF